MHIIRRSIACFSLFFAFFARLCVRFFFSFFSIFFVPWTIPFNFIYFSFFPSFFIGLYHSLSIVSLSNLHILFSDIIINCDGFRSIVVGWMCAQDKIKKKLFHMVRNIVYTYLSYSGWKKKELEQTFFILVSAFTSKFNIYLF